MTVVVSVQARMGSTRLPGKVLLPLGEKRVLEWVLDRCLATRADADVVVATGEPPENDAIREWCRRNDREFVTGPESDLLSRHRTVASEYDADVLVRVTGDCPFVPPSEIDRLLAEHEREGSRYTTNNDDAMPLGTSVDVIDRAVLDELVERGDDHPVLRLRENPETWGTRFSPNDDWNAVAAAHVAVDTPADYWGLTDAVAATGSDPYDVCQWVADNR